MDDRENMMVSRMESALRRQLTPEEIYEVQLWDRGRTLSQIVHTDSWAILLDTIKSYVDGASESLIRMSPGSEHVKEAHAVAFALSDFYLKFQEDINNAIEASTKTPPILREAARTMGTAGPPESL
jgi:hypothetical protein